VDIYDSVTNTWSTARLSIPRDATTATTIGTKAFIAGGYNEQSPQWYDLVDIYDSVTNTWSIAHLSVGRSLPVSTTVGTKALFAGGVSHQTTYAPSNRVDIYTKNNYLF